MSELISKADVVRMYSKVNLCDWCLRNYPECGSDNIEFGDDVGYDNICFCSDYKPERMESGCVGCEHYDNCDRAERR